MHPRSNDQRQSSENELRKWCEDDWWPLVNLWRMASDFHSFSNRQMQCECMTCQLTLRNHYINGLSRPITNVHEWCWCHQRSMTIPEGLYRFICSSFSFKTKPTKVCSFSWTTHMSYSLLSRRIREHLWITLITYSAEIQQVAEVFVGLGVHRRRRRDKTVQTTTHCMCEQMWNNTHIQLFYGPFPGPPGWAGARRELLDFMVQGKINRGRHTDHPAGRHSIRTKQCPPPPSPHFLQAGCPSCRPTNSVKALKANVE